AAPTDPSATLIKAEIDHVFVKESIQPGESQKQIRHQLHGAVPDPGVEPVADPGPSRVKPNDARLIKFVDVKFVPQQSEDIGPASFQNIGLIGDLSRFASVPPPTQAHARSHD